MKKQYTSIAKITRPSSLGVLNRKRLFRLLDRGAKKAVVWVSGPAGSGKTTLLSSYIEARGLPNIWYRLDIGDSNAAEFFHYMGLAGRMAAPRRRSPLPHLTPEYLMGMTAFTRRFFENLFARLRPPFVLVLDDYQSASREAPLHEIIAGAVDVLPEGGTIIVLSRGSPPPELARLRANGAMEVIAPSELSLLHSESKAIIRLRGAADGHAFTGDEILKMERRIGGWVGGLVLILEGEARGGLKTRSIKNLSNDAVFEYFAGEIFEKIDPEMSKFLMETAFFTEMTARMATSLTGLGRSARILSYLNRNHCFTEKHLKPHPVYSYHPLFREFLLTRAGDAFSPKRITVLKQSVALLMEEAGFVDEAAAMYCEAGDRDGLARVVVTHAGTFLAQGRSAALSEWLRCFPESYLKKEPWLRYWLGVSCAQSDPGEAKLHLERAFRLFNSRKDPAGVFLSWAGVTKAIFYAFDDFRGFDRRIKALYGLMSRYPFPSKEIEEQVTSSMFMALMFREPWHRDIERWAERALVLANNSEDVNLRAETGFGLAYHYRWKGDGARCRVIIDSLLGRQGPLKTAPMPRLTSRVIEAAFCWESGDHKACARMVSEELEASRASGVCIANHMLLGQAAASALANEDLERAADNLKKMSPVLERGTRFDRSFYHFLLAWKGLVGGDASLAGPHAGTALDLIVEVGCPATEALCRALLSMALHEEGEDKKAAGELRKMCGLAKKTGYALTMYICLTIEARVALDRGNEKKGLDRLRELFALGRECGIVKHLLFRPSVMAGLCVRALEEGIEVDYVRGLVRKCGLMPDRPPLDVERWPWPIKIFTLGRFSLVKDDEEVSFSGRAQARPLLMLKALVALGGRGVRAMELYDRLWPDSDGDAASGAFNTTLHRLRKLLGNDEAVELSDGLVSLNPRLVRVDTWAFERLLGQADEEIKAGNKKAGGRLIDRALRIYEGPFMAMNRGQHMYLPMAERLRSKFLRYIGRLGRLYEGAGEFERAIDRFKRGIEVDVLAEEFYEGLMLCYKRLGRRAEAINVYNRLEKTLSVMLGVEPSPQSRAIYAELKADGGAGIKKKE